jgi:hypothetical protein
MHSYQEKNEKGRKFMYIMTIMFILGSVLFLMYNVVK